MKYIKTINCKYCGAPVLWIQSKKGKWYLTDAYCMPDGDEVPKVNRLGFIPYHVCKKELRV